MYALNEEQQLVLQMKQDGYSEAVIDHWMHPRNYGALTAYNGHSGKYTGSCGDTMWFWIQVTNGRIHHVSFVSDICIGSITAGSMLCELVEGTDTVSALLLSGDDVLAALGGLPDQYTHCATLAKKTLELAISDYNSYRGDNWKKLYIRK